MQKFLNAYRQLISEFLNKKMRKRDCRELTSMSEGGERKNGVKKIKNQFQTRQVVFTGVDLVSWSICRSLGLEALTQGKTEHV